MLTPGNRRQYSAEDIQDLRVLLEKTARKPGDYLPGRRDQDHLQVIGVMNFKGGSGKTTTSAHLAQRLALRGYRVLAIDLDPQASLTALHGIQPELDSVSSLYETLRYDAERQPISAVMATPHTNGTCGVNSPNTNSCNARTARVATIGRQAILSDGRSGVFTSRVMSCSIS